jgi:hypothetical protein
MEKLTHPNAARTTGKVTVKTAVCRAAQLPQPNRLLQNPLSPIWLLGKAAVVAVEVVEIVGLGLALL